MVHHVLPAPVGGVVAVGPQEFPGHKNYDVIPLLPWTWTKKSIIDQLTPKPTIPRTPDDPPVEPQFMVKPIEYSTGFKPGQLMKMYFPLSKSSFI